MKRKRGHRILFLLVCLTVFVLGLVYRSNTVFFSLLTPDTKYPRFSYKQEIVKLEGILQQEGPRDALQYLQTAYTAYDPVEVHNLFHWYGDALFKREGVEGLRLCDSSFNWGCFHGFFGTAFTHEGRSLLPQAEKVCQREKREPGMPNGCLHGIGHGLLALEGGYEYNHLVKALGDCDELLERKTQTDCYNGVFMEYNMRSMINLNEESRLARPLNSADPLDPCNKLAEKYQVDCYYEQADWWRISIGRNFTKMGQYCDAISISEIAKSCFRGVGRGIWGESKFNEDKAVKDCRYMPSSTGVLACVGLILDELVVVKRTPELRGNVCRQLQPDQQAECFRLIQEQDEERIADFR